MRASVAAAFSSIFSLDSFVFTTYAATPAVSAVTPATASVTGFASMARLNPVAAPVAAVVAVVTNPIAAAIPDNVVINPLILLAMNTVPSAVPTPVIAGIRLFICWIA